MPEPLSSATPEISVCITTRGRPALLDLCLKTLSSQIDAPPFELLICCQADTLAAPIVRARFPNAIIGLVEEAFPGGARNFLVERAKGELLFFLDDDVTFDPELLQRLAEAGRRYPETSVFGGPNLTPPHSTLFQTVQGAILGSVLATGPVRRRYGRHSAGQADERFFTLCNMAVRRDVMRSFGPSLSGGEENALLNELAERGALMRYQPDLVVFHERRSTYGGFVKQMEKYGRGRGQVMVRHPRSTRPAHVLPIVMWLWILSLPFVAVLVTPWYLVTVALYAMGLVAAGSAVALGMGDVPIKKRVGVVVLGAGLTATVHFCYGIGVARGLVRGWARRRQAPKSIWQEIPLSVEDTVAFENGAQAS